MWFSRMIMPDDDLTAILSSPHIEAYYVMQEKSPVGLLELNFAEPQNCELSFFGLTRNVIGKGLGRALMNVAIAKAWAKPINRFWLHTCHFDHPNALGFYQRSGFKPYKLMLEIHDDARLTGHLPQSACPQVALIKASHK
jgi:GNAT superfamily N-acetyltransferase